jgi:hypothetical protein
MPLPNKRRADERDGAERPTGKHKPVQLWGCCNSPDF